MSIKLEFISLIIPIKNIEEYYPGGYSKFKKDNHHLIGRKIWFDNFIVRDGAMNAMDIQLLIQQWESLGLKGIVEENGSKKWKELCVVDFFGGPTLPCDWLVYKDGYISHIQDKTNIMIDRDNVIGFSSQSFDPIDWLKQFREASKKKIGFRELRKEIFEQTIEIVKKGFYHIDNQKISLPKFKTIEDTEFFDRPTKLTQSNNDFKTKFSVIEADCIEIGELLTKMGFSVCVLNMASRQNPGGGVTNGAGAQEENIFRRSNIFMSLYQFKDYSIEYGIERSDKSYPLNRNTGGVYSKNVMVFRASENNGYAFLKKPFQLSFVSVPAISRPELDFINGKYYITQSLIEPTKEKIRTILRITGKFKHDCLVLSAFGCGAFKNPPHHMAKLFKEVFFEDEFKSQFKLIVFAILDDHNSWREHNPEGNILPFFKEFESNFAQQKI